MHIFYLELHSERKKKTKWQQLNIGRVHIKFHMASFLKTGEWDPQPHATFLSGTALGWSLCGPQSYTLEFIIPAHSHNCDSRSHCFVEQGFIEPLLGAAPGLDIRYSGKSERPKLVCLVEPASYWMALDSNVLSSSLSQKTLRPMPCLL